MVDSLPAVQALEVLGQHFLQTVLLWGVRERHGSLLIGVASVMDVILSRAVRDAGPSSRV